MVCTMWSDSDMWDWSKSNTNHSFNEGFSASESVISSICCLWPFWLTNSSIWDSFICYIVRRIPMTQIRTWSGFIGSDWISDNMGAELAALIDSFVVWERCSHKNLLTASYTNISAGSLHISKSGFISTDLIIDRNCALFVIFLGNPLRMRSPEAVIPAYLLTFANLTTLKSYSSSYRKWFLILRSFNIVFIRELCSPCAAQNPILSVLLNTQSRIFFISCEIISEPVRTICS